MLNPASNESISSAAVELEQLRAKVQRQEQQLVELGVQQEAARAQAAEQVVQQVRNESVQTAPVQAAQRAVELVAPTQYGLSAEQDDMLIQQLFAVASQRGIKETFAAIQKINNPHVDDDFHRFLVQYLIHNAQLPGIPAGSELFRAINMSLFEVTLPEVHPGEQGKQLRELMNLMEQFYAGMLSVANDTSNSTHSYFTLEIANTATSDHIVFYCGVPNAKMQLFEKQILGLYPEARIERIPDDYNVFNREGAAAGAYAKAAKSDFLAIKTYDKIDHDPLDIILNVFSKLDTIGEGAALQIIIQPSGDKHFKRTKKAIEKIKEGMSIEKAEREIDSVMAGIFKIGKEIIMGAKKEESGQEKKIDEAAIQSMNQKIESTIVETNIRIVASSHNEVRAKKILGDMQSAFNQFTDTQGNGIQFAGATGNYERDLFHRFSYRQFSPKQALNLNLRELATIFHFPQDVDNAPQLKQAAAKTAPADMLVPTEGLYMGANQHRNQEKNIFMTPKDRVRHFYVIGQTGTGKTYFLRHLIKQDIENGEGCCFIDPHGSDVDEILSYVPKERIDDVIYFDPAYAPRPMGLNMLEYDTRFPEQKTFVVDEMLSIFNKLFDMKTAGGPMFEQYFRNATMLVIDDPDSGNTLLEISRVLADDKFREMKLARCRNPIVIQFWREVASKAGGEASLQNIVPYITSKFDVFLSNEIMRPIVGQPQSAFNFRDIMDNRKILLVNLSKGRLGEINANLIGLILVGKILMAALSRADTADLKSLAPFYLYIDEFQNVTTNSISQILSEARKYGLGLNIAHQFIAQLQDDIKNAVFGNVGSVGVFRISPDDAEYLERRLAPTFSAQDIMKLTMGNYYLQMLGGGTPLKPFNVNVPEIMGGRMDIVPKLKQYSYMKYGRDRGQVESEIMAKYEAARRPAEQAPAPPNPFGV